MAESHRLEKSLYHQISDSEADWDYITKIMSPKVLISRWRTE